MLRNAQKLVTGGKRKSHRGVGKKQNKTSCDAATGEDEQRWWEKKATRKKAVTTDLKKGDWNAKWLNLEGLDEKKGLTSAIGKVGR